MALIEKENYKDSCCDSDFAEKYFNDGSQTIKLNRDKVNNSASWSTKDKTDDERNRERWKWLIKGWKDMSFEEKLGLFMPKLHYITPRDVHIREFDDYYAGEIQKWCFESCRNVNKIHFDNERTGVPTIIVEMAPIDVNLIPDAEIKAYVKQWGMKYGFIERSCKCEDCDC